MSLVQLMPDVENAGLFPPCNQIVPGTGTHRETS